MKKFALALFALAASSAVEARPHTSYVGNWTIISNEGACTMQIGIRGTGFTIGAALPVTAMVTLENPAWRGFVTPGMPLHLSARFDRRPGLEINAVGRFVGRAQTPALSFNVPIDGEFMRSFASSYALFLDRDGAEFETLVLDDSRRAVAAFTACLRNKLKEKP